MNPQTSLKMGYVGSKTRSPGQILEKPYVGSRGHIFSPIFMKLVWNVCLDEISDEFERGQKVDHKVKSQKNLLYAPEATFSG